MGPSPSGAAGEGDIPRAAGPSLADLPPDRLRCPHCDYSAYGLPQSRCPECGREFTWEQVRVNAMHFHSNLFEHDWLGDPVPALLRSWTLASFSPGRLWSKYNLHDRPRAGVLIFLVALQYLLFRYGWQLTAYVVDPMMNRLAGMVPRPDGQPLRFIYPFRISAETLRLFAVWHVSTFAALLVFFEPHPEVPFPQRPTFGHRWRHILRVYAHATVFAALCPVIWCVLEAGLDICLHVILRTTNRVLARDAYFHLRSGVLYLAAFSIWVYVWIGYRRYLRMPLGWAIASVCLFAGWVAKEVVRLTW